MVCGSDWTIQHELLNHYSDQTPNHLKRQSLFPGIGKLEIVESVGIRNELKLHGADGLGSGRLSW